jgi:hypothetical protein
VTADLLKLRVRQQTLTEAIHGAFSDVFFHSKEVQALSGQHYLTGEMIRKYVLKLVERDCELTPFRYIKSEEKIQHLFRLTNGTEIQLKGYIDRIDEVDGQLRIIDYKTGAKKPLILKSIESLFNSTDEKRQSAILQVFIYAWMYPPSLPSGGPEGGIQPLLYYVRDFFSDGFNPVIYQGQTKEPIMNFADYRNEFEDLLRSCLDSIFDSTIPFMKTPCTNLCSYCTFAKVCGR